MQELNRALYTCITVHMRDNVVASQSAMIFKCTSIESERRHLNGPHGEHSISTKLHNLHFRSIEHNISGLLIGVETTLEIAQGRAQIQRGLCQAVGLEIYSKREPNYREWIE